MIQTLDELHKKRLENQGMNKKLVNVECKRSVMEQLIPLTPEEHYFIFGNLRVFEEGGHKDRILKNESVNMEDFIFNNKGRD